MITNSQKKLTVYWRLQGKVVIIYEQKYTSDN